MASRLGAILFPPSPRSLPYNRGISIAFRTLHLLGSSLLIGGHAFGAEPQRLIGLLYLTVGSGLGLAVLELYRSCDWVYQGMGLLVIVKTAITALTGIWWEQRVALLCVVVVLGSIGSHMPADYRHYSPWHGRVLQAHTPKRQRPPQPNP
jgi:hypothetical protein